MTVGKAKYRNPVRTTVGVGEAVDEVEPEACEEIKASTFDMVMDSGMAGWWNGDNSGNSKVGDDDSIKIDGGGGLGLWVRCTVQRK
ncbi:unnamed protein product [Prunus brigantina]